MRVGLVCPYSFDIPGGVQAHVADLARTLIGLGHHVSVLAPGDDEGPRELPEYVVRSGRSVPIPYNGSVARLSFGPMSYTRVRRWIRAGRFDVLHVHEPVAPSLSMLALMVAAQIPEQALYPFDRATDEGNDFIRMCRRWPEASPAPAAGPPAGSLPDVPVLMLSGQMDLRTPVETARSAAADWPHAQVLTIPATGHSTLTADFSRCTHDAAVRFFRGQAVAARCKQGTTFFFPFPPAPLSLSDLRGVKGVPGARGKAISAAQLTLFDVTVEFLSTVLAAQDLDLHGGGLRGGRWALNLNDERPVLRLDEVEYLPGMRVSGTVRGIGTRRERSNLRLSGPRTPDGVVRIGRKWITGRLDGKPVRSRVPGSRSSASAAAAGPRSTATRAQLLRIARRLAHRPRRY